MRTQYFLFTLGCQYNIFESQEIEKIFLELGIEKSAGEKSADFILTNICSVRQKPIDRVFGKLKIWQKLKIKKPDLKIIATGCILPRDKKKFQEKFDFIFAPGDFRALKKYLLSQIKKPVCAEFKKDYQDSGLVPIMTGCNNFCTYCAVPYTRGREKSFAKKEIIQKVKKLIRLGTKEIILLGQNVNSYQYGFEELLEKIAKLPGNFEITFLSPHPKDTTKKLIEIIAKYPKIKKEFHLPLQSGNNRILELMNRNYSTDDYLKLAQMIRKTISKIRLSTDIIVGFPTETKKEFEETYKFCKKIKFAKAFVSIYSPRPGTYAEKNLKDDIPFQEKRRRWLKLDRLINK